MLHIGRKFSIGIGKETVRATPVAAAFWLPKMSLTLDDKINTVVDSASYGIIEDGQDQDITGKYSQGQIEGRITDISFGLILLATLGTETSQSVHAGETTVYDHIFNVNESSQHPSLSISAVGPNETTGLVYALGMIDTLDISLEIQKYATYKMGFRANANAAQANTVAFTSENAFTPKHGVVKFATNLAGLAAASAITLRKLTLNIKKNIEEDWTVGTIVAADRVNKQFTVEGTMEIVYTDRSYIDTIMIGDLNKAIRIAVVNSDVVVGSTANPTVQIDLAKTALSEVARKLDNDGAVTQTLKFKAFYSIADTKMLTVTLTNTRATAY